jgi:acyl-CoA thioester hydrolase
MITFQAQWSDMDQNGHMRTTAYLAAAENSRMQYFSSLGFSMEEFMRLSIGPVVQTDELRYRSELRLLDGATLEIRCCALSADGARFGLRNIFTREEGEVACIVTTIGGWLDLRRRHLTVPPPNLFKILSTLVRTDDFFEPPSPLKQS